jgi:phage portal protein BeeE
VHPDQERRGDKAGRTDPQHGAPLKLRGDDLRNSNNGETRALPVPENELPLLGAYTATNITATAALAIADVWAAVRVLADAASSLPLHVYRKAANGRERSRRGGWSTCLTGPARRPARRISRQL